MALLETIIGIVITIAVIWILFRIFRLRESHIEARETRKGGLTFRKLARRFREARWKKREERAVTQAAKKSLPKEKTPTTDTARTAEKAAEAETKVEEKTAELEKTTTALLADLQGTTDEVLKEVKEKRSMEQVEEKETAAIPALEKRLRILNKFDKIDQTTADYLHQYFQSLAEHLGKKTNYEQQNKEHHQKFVKHLKKSVKHLLPISRHAKKELSQLKRKEGREKKTFKKELRSLNRAIRKKYRLLKKEKRKGKKADPNLIAQLTKEIAMLQRNAAELQKIKDQLSKTHELIDLEIKQLKEIMQQIIRIERSQRRYSRKLGKREKDLNDRLKKLTENQNKLEQGIQDFSGAEKIHGLVLSFSQHLNDYFNFYLKTLKDDLAFELKLKEIITQNILIERKMLSFTKLLASLDESEAAVNKGTAAIISIISVMITEDISGSLQKEAATLRQETKFLDYQNRLEKYLQALDQEIEKKTLLAVAEINKLIKKEEILIAKNEALHEQESTHLANSMATLTKRKLDLDKRYMSQAVKFGEQLAKRNQLAGAAYQQAT